MRADGEQLTSCAYRPVDRVRPFHSKSYAPLRQQWPTGSFLRQHGFSVMFAARLNRNQDVLNHRLETRTSRELRRLESLQAQSTAAATMFANKALCSIAGGDAIRHHCHISHQYPPPFELSDFT